MLTVELYRCKNLRKADLPNSLKKMEFAVFYGCVKLEKIEFGKKLKKPETYKDVKGQVTTDYQQECEKAAASNAAARLELVPVSSAPVSGLPYLRFRYLRLLFALSFFRRRP